ncbi:MAG: hypothetical protein HYT87_08185 [Nitrospirae bacterium]|nr:hypothetical protein [Nitrospirota bacterium]
MVRTFLMLTRVLEGILKTQRQQTEILHTHTELLKTNTELFRTNTKLLKANNLLLQKALSNGRLGGNGRGRPGRPPRSH